MTDAGFFGPNSVAWRLHSDPVMLAGGMRALLVQALNPRAMAAVDQFGKFREDPWGRLERTSNFVLATTFGDTATAEAAAARVRAVHSRIFGVDPYTGTPYSATDPDLLLWIHAVEVDSFVVAYRAYAGCLSRADADRYVAEMARVAELVELPPAMAPRSMGQLRDYLASVTGLAVTPAARDGLRTVLAPPMPAMLRPAWVIPATAAIAILPGYARRMYRIPWFPPATIPVRAGVFGLSRVLIKVRPRHPMVQAARERVQPRPAAA
jgi:uncharacterized protein (DUF2236 family)